MFNFNTDILKALNLNIQISSTTPTEFTTTQTTTDTHDDFRLEDSTMVHTSSDEHSVTQLSVPKQGKLL